MTDDDLTQKIIGCAYKVHNPLAADFLKKSMRTLFELNWKNWDYESSRKSQSMFCMTEE